jgi:hypothetical protein
MTLRLFELPEHPHQIAASKTDSFVSDGAFFLDFSRQLEHLRWFGLHNRWLGLTVGLFVPVVHQGQDTGELVIGVQRTDPCFAQLRALWKAHYPSRRPPPTTAAEGFKVVVDFAAQFPEDSR